MQQKWHVSLDKTRGGGIAQQAWASLGTCPGSGPGPCTGILGPKIKKIKKSNKI